MNIVMGQKQGYSGTVNQNSIDTFVLSARWAKHDAHSLLLVMTSPACHSILDSVMMTLGTSALYKQKGLRVVK